MATIKTKFRSSSVEGREGALYYQVILSIPCRDGTGKLSSIGRGTDKTGQNPTGKGYQDIKPIRFVYSG